jgi:FixJ family two-component response regulator
VPRDLEIAVIDDDEPFRVALVEALASFGYGADGYASAEDYIGSIGCKSFHCVVTDIHMPGMSGLADAAPYRSGVDDPGRIDHGTFKRQPGG